MNNHLCSRRFGWNALFFQPSSTGFAAPTAAGGTDGGRFGARAGQGAAAQYGGPYASVYGTQQVVSYNCFVLF
jgi:hypothetical protein